MKILHLIDSLNPGGAERMAIGYVNALAVRNFEVYLWSTREEGLLKNSIHPSVNYHFLNRKGPVGIKALLKASKAIKKEGIQLIHAHSTSFFFATLLKWFCPGLKLVWHDHYGKSEMLQERQFAMLKKCSAGFDTIFSVNKTLQRWAVQNLKCKEVYYIKNFISAPARSTNPISLQGASGKRIVCVANFRIQKNHFLLLEAFENLTKTADNWTLHLVGKNWDDAYYKEFVKRKTSLTCADKVFYYGSCEDILGVLQQATIGVLSSDSEGLPLAILEYALSGLPVVCTDVGYCKEVVKDYAQVVPPNQPEALAEALLFYIQNSETAATDAAKLQQHVTQTYTDQAVLPQVIAIYERLLKK